MRSDELHAELEQLADDIEPFTPNALEVHRRTRRRRIILRSAAAVLALVVATGVAVSVRDGGKKRVEVTSTKLEENLAAFGRADFVLFPASVEAFLPQLDDAPEVTKYALLPAGFDVGVAPGMSGGGWTDAVCRLRESGGVAVQIDDDSPQAANPSTWLSDKTPVVDVDPNGHIDVEIYMKIDATKEQTQAIAAALAADDRLTSPPRFVNHATAFREFSEVFADDPTLVESASPEILPESFRVHVKNVRDAAFSSHYESLPGVDTAIDHHDFGLPFTRPPWLQPGQTPNASDAPDAEIFMDIEATPAQVAAVSDRLNGHADVKDHRYLNHEDAFEEFKRDFADQQELLKDASAAVLPESFRVTANSDDRIDAIERDFATMAGVDTVIVARTGPEDVCND